jgi:hypothetical protein
MVLLENLSLISTVCNRKQLIHVDTNKSQFCKMFITIDPSAYFPHFLRKIRYGIIAFEQCYVVWGSADGMVYCGVV